MYREFETLFVAYASHLSGKVFPHIIRGSLQFKEDLERPDPENVRDAKGWVTQSLTGGRVYKPTTDQLSLTRVLDMQLLTDLNLPCFDTLVRCVKKIIEHKGQVYVYPEV